MLEVDRGTSIVNVQVRASENDHLDELISDGEHDIPCIGFTTDGINTLAYYRVKSGTRIYSGSIGDVTA